nr:hypothetical protein [Tanacetum cinerariifolium]
KHKSVASKSCYVCGSYLHLIKDYDLHEQRFTKRNAEGKGILGRRPAGKPVNPNRPKPVFAGQQNPVSTGQQNSVSAVSAGEAILACNSIPLSVSAGDGILGPRPLNIQPKSTYFHSFTYNNQQIIFPITHNSLYSLYMTAGLNGKTAVKPSAGWPWIKYGNYMPPFNNPDIDESQMIYGKKATDSSEIKTNDDSISHSNDSILFYFNDRFSEPSTNDL